MNYVNLPASSHQRSSKKLLKKFTPVLILAAVLVLIGVLFSFMSGTSTVFDFITKGTTLKSSDGRINVLLLGNGGGVHEGADLTDTVMVASYNLETHKVYLISLPRDFWVDNLHEKINAVYET